jgi:copper chaperone CopZ
MSTGATRKPSGFAVQPIRNAADTPKSARRIEAMEYYVHHVPGRLRVRIPAIRRNPGNAADIQCLLNIPGVDNIKVNHLTGSVVVTFETGSITPEKLLAVLKQKGYYDDSRVVTCDEKIQRASTMAAAKVGRAVFGYAVGKALESSGLSLLAALI